MGVCPSLDPEVRVIQNQNQRLKLFLLSELKDLRMYNFYTPVLKAVENLPTRYFYNEGILEDIDKLRFHAQRKGADSIQSKISVFGENPFEEQIRNSCLILENQIVSDAQSKQFQQKEKVPQQAYQNEGQLDGNRNLSGNTNMIEGTQSFQNNLTRNQSLVAQMNLIYGREINREQYSQALKLFLKWVQYFNEHAYGGFLKTIYKSFCQSLYILDKSQFQTLVDEVSIFVQYMVKVYTHVHISVQTKIYSLQSLNKTVDGKLFKNENVYNLIMSFMFRKTKIKGLIRMMIRENHSDKIRKFQEKLRLYAKKGISHFGIDTKFILIKNSELDRLIKKSYQNTPLSKHSRTIPEQQQDELNESDLPQMLESFKSRIDTSCYEKSLRLLGELSSPSEGISPISKLKTIIAIARSIKQQIQEFYVKEMGFCEDKVPELDPDNLTAIVIYLITVNNNAALFEELKIVEYFTTTNTLNCISGYYLNLFNAAIEVVLQLKI